MRAAPFPADDLSTVSDLWDDGIPGICYSKSKWAPVSSLPHCGPLFAFVLFFPAHTPKQKAKNPKHFFCCVPRRFPPFQHLLLSAPRKKIKAGLLPLSKLVIYAIIDCQLVCSLTFRKFIFFLLYKSCTIVEHEMEHLPPKITR